MVTLTIEDPQGHPEILITRHATGYRVESVGWVAASLDLSGSVLSREPAEGVHPLDAADIFEQSIAPRLGQLVGRPSLHASCVEVGGRAVAFQGLSGVGKSTLAALMIERGARLVTDDALSLEPRPTTCLANPCRPVTRLTTESAAAVRDSFGSGWLGSEKVSFEVPFAPAPVPLRRIYLLGRNAPEPTIEPLRQRDAMLEIAGHLHRLDPNDPRLLTMELEFLEAVTSVVRVARLSHPRRFEERDALVDAILRDLEDPR